jgi:hypothetical protein
MWLQRTVGGQIVSMIVTNRPVGLLRQGYGGQDARAYTSVTTVNPEMRPNQTLTRKQARVSPARRILESIPLV